MVHKKLYTLIFLVSFSAAYGMEKSLIPSLAQIGRPTLGLATALSTASLCKPLAQKTWQKAQENKALTAGVVGGLAASALLANYYCPQAKYMLWSLMQKPWVALPVSAVAGLKFLRQQLSTTATGSSSSSTVQSYNCQSKVFTDVFINVFKDKLLPGEFKKLFEKLRKINQPDHSIYLKLLLESKYDLRPIIYFPNTNSESWITKGDLECMNEMCKQNNIPVLKSSNVEFPNALIKPYQAKNDIGGFEKIVYKGKIYYVKRTSDEQKQHNQQVDAILETHLPEALKPKVNQDFLWQWIHTLLSLQETSPSVREYVKILIKACTKINYIHPDDIPSTLLESAENKGWKDEIIDLLKSPSQK